MLKLWKGLRGKKRHFGALVFATLAILRMFGVDIPPEVEQAVTIIGTAIFGLGWLDKGKRALIDS